MAETNSNNLQTQAPPRKKDVQALLADKNMQAQMALAMPRHMSPERLSRIALTEIRKVPKLASCEPASFMGAIMQCAQLGLEPGNALGHAYLLPFEVRKKQGGQWVTVRTDCQLIIGYRGMIDLARRSGQIVSLSCRAVHEGDRFSYEYGLDEKLDHKPQENLPAKPKLTHVYAVAKLQGGGVQFEVMTLAEVENVRAQSKAKDNGPWVSHFEEMAKKTVIRRLFKYLPVSIELQTAVGLDERADAGLNQDNAMILNGDYKVLPDEEQLPDEDIDGDPALDPAADPEVSETPTPAPRERKPRNDLPEMG